MVWDGLEVVKGGLEMNWGGLGVSKDPDRSYHYTKNPFEVYLPFKG